MPEPLSDDQLARITEAEADTAHGVLSLLDEIDRLKDDLEEAAQVRVAAGQQIEQLRAALDRTPTDDEVARLREHGCPHVVTSGEGTSHCGLAVMEMAKAIAEIEQLQARREELVATVRDVADTIARWSISGSTASTLRDACDRAEGKG